MLLRYQFSYLFTDFPIVRNYSQPRARTEDLVCQYGLRYDLITITASGCPSPSSSTYNSPTPSYTTIPGPVSSSSSSSPKTPFADLAITWGNRKVALTVKDPNTGGRRKVLVEVTRERGESLESLARMIVGEWLSMVRGGYGSASREPAPAPAPKPVKPKSTSIWRR